MPAGYKKGTGYAQYTKDSPVPAVLVGARAVKAPTAPPGMVAFATSILTVRCKLGATSAVAAGGVGGWVDVPLPGRTAKVEYAGTPNYTLSIPVLLDGLANRESVEPQIAAFYAIGRPPEGSPRATLPPIIRVGGMVPHGDREWVLTEFAEGEAIWDGHSRIRLWATVSLAAYRALDVVKVQKKSTAKASTRVYTVKRGDTLGSIARDEMGAKTATAIAKGVATIKALNKIRDPKSIKAGQKIKVPR